MRNFDVRIGWLLTLSSVAAALMLVVGPVVAQESSATPIPEDLKAPCQREITSASACHRRSDLYLPGQRR